MQSFLDIHELLECLLGPDVVPHLERHRAQLGVVQLQEWVQVVIVKSLGVLVQNILENFDGARSLALCEKRRA